jgi:hypothetical protein
MHFGELPATMALDAAPAVNQAQMNGRPSLPSDEGFLSESSRASDQEGSTGGERTISRSKAHRIWEIGKKTLSPEDLDRLTTLLKGVVDYSLPDEEDSDVEDEVPPFVQRAKIQGMPDSDGKIRDMPNMTGDAAHAQFMREYGLDRIGRCPAYGEPVPPTRAQRQATQLALDARTLGGESAYEAFASEWPSVARIGRCY